eukprot:scaffold13.g377.t1
MTTPSEEESVYSSYYDSESERTMDTLEDLKNRFTFEGPSEFALKLRSEAGAFSVGADLTHCRVGSQTIAAAVIKPAQGSRFWRRLRIDSQGTVQLRCPKIPVLRVLTMDIEGHANPFTRHSNIAFRLGTKWDPSRGQIRHKRRWALGDATEARLHWAVNYHLPEMEGSLGAAARQVSREVHADIGYAHFEVPKLEVVVWPWKARQGNEAAEAEGAAQASPPPPRAAPAPAAAGAAGAAAGAAAAPAAPTASGSGARGWGGGGAALEDAANLRGSCPAGASLGYTRQGAVRAAMADVESQRQLVRARLAVQGMSCAACEGAVRGVLAELPGAVAAAASALGSSSTVTYDRGRCSGAAAAAALSAAGFEARVEEEAAVGAETALARFAVEGMSCSACSAQLESALAALPGVRHAAVSLTLQTAVVEYDPGLTAPAAMQQAMLDAGFETSPLGSGAAAMLLLELGPPSSGRGGPEGGAAEGANGTAQASAAAVPPEEAAAVLGREQGVLEVVPHPATGRLEVRYNADVVGPRRLVQAVQAATGQPAKPVVDDHSGGAALREKERRFWLRKFLVSLVFSLPLFVLAMILQNIPPSKHAMETMSGGFMIGDIVAFVLATPVQASVQHGAPPPRTGWWVGWVFHRDAWRALRRGRPNMAVLVSVGTTAAYVYSLISVGYSRAHAEYESSGHFFETSALLITFICLGKYLESAAKGEHVPVTDLSKTGQAVAELLKLAPSTAILCSTDAAGRVLPGARIPADGEVEAGQSHVDESMVTGESVPVAKHPGSTVIGGTVNCGSLLHVRTTRVGRDSVLSQIVSLVEQAQMSKAPIQAFADRLSAVFVPIVLLCALATWLGWFLAGVTAAYPSEWLPEGSTPFLFALLFGIAVVVIACPCALGLATPTALLVGTGVAAGQGILIKSAEAVENVRHVKTVVFDKTGTLTEGEPAVVSMSVVDEAWRPHEALLLLAAASAEAGSEHPLAAAVLKHTAARLSGSGGAGGGIAGSKAADDPGLLGDESPPSSCELSLADGPVSPRSPLVAAELLRRRQQAAGARGRPRALDAGQLGWLAPCSHSEAEPGKGVRAWVALPPASLKDVPAALLSPRGAAAPASGSSASLAAAGAGSSSAEVRVAIGNRRLMAEERAAVPPAALEWVREWESLGSTCIFVAIEGRVAAALAVSDPIRPEAPAVVAALRQRGYAVVLLTGDNWQRQGGGEREGARAVAARLGILQVQAEVLPEGKVLAIKELQRAAVAGRGRRRRGRRLVAMVGDGVNDAAAMAQSDVGIGIGSGTEVSGGEGVVVALDLAQRIYSRIKLNYVWACGYNLVAVPIAAGALYPGLHVQLPPWVAGAAMALSSVSVVCSSLLLRWYKRPSLGSGARAAAVPGWASGSGAGG